MKRCISVVLVLFLGSSMQLFSMYSGLRTLATRVGATRSFLSAQQPAMSMPEASRMSYPGVSDHAFQLPAVRRLHTTYAAEGSAPMYPVDEQEVFVRDEQWRDLTRPWSDRTGYYAPESSAFAQSISSQPKSWSGLYLSQATDPVFSASSSRVMEDDLPASVLSWEKYEPESYEELDKAQKKMIKEDKYAECLAKYRQLQDVKVDNIMYTVDGHEVEGFVLSPKTEPGEKRPLVIYNRGGHRKWGRVDLNTIMNNMLFLAENGYIVVASQYRGTKDDSVTDEFGGIDVADPLKLLDIALQFDHVDKENIFTVGFSRGTIMNHRMMQELNGRIPIRASACIGVVSDLDKLLRENSFALPLLQDAVKNFDENFTQECKKRSVVWWLDVYNNTPVVFLHNEQDPIVPVSQAYLLKEKFDERGKPEHKMVIYPDKGHALNHYREEGNKEILNWLNKYKK